MAAPRSSTAPLWLTLGFASGLAFGWIAFHEETPSPAPAATPAPVVPPDRTEIPVNAGTLRAVEQTFERWGGYAVWENDLTEIAVWDARRKRHSDFYEVRRHDGKFYFRSLAALSRPIIDHGVSATMPIAFTEPQWMRDQFYREHPDYDPATAPRVELPPRPPERFATPPRSLTPTPDANDTDTTPREYRRRETKPLTPGAGGD
jgi:hypothetical protein